MSYTSLPQTQRGIIERLRACAELSAIVTGVHDAVPSGQPKPYVVYESVAETPDETFGQGGHQVDVDVDVHTDDGSLSKSGRGTAGFLSGEQIAEIVCRELLDPDTPLVIDGHDVVDLTLIGVRIYRANDAQDSRIASIRFTATLEDEIDG